MKKYLNRSCTGEERSELLRYIQRTRSPEEMNEIWEEAWEETGGDIQYSDLHWEDILKIEAGQKRSGAKILSVYILRISAVAAILVGLFFFARWWTQELPFIVYQTGFGENIEFVLDDGTQIHLNANSKLLWSKNWQSEGLRRVKLEGEAYFDVSSVYSEAITDLSKSTEYEEYNEPRIPFEVHTKDLTIRVLGTSFNAVQRRGKTEVSLDEGIVELALHRKSQKNPKDSPDNLNPGKRNVESDALEDLEVSTIKMKPGEWVRFSALEDDLQQKALEQTDPALEWKDGTLAYQDVEFRFMLENLEDIYGKTFEVTNPDLLGTRVNIGVPYKDWDTVKDMMKWMLGIEVIELADDQIRIEKRKENY